MQQRRMLAAVVFLVVHGGVCDPARAYVPGDVTGNGKTDISDLQCVVVAVVGAQTPQCAADAGALDLDCNGGTDIVDVQSEVLIVLAWPAPGLSAAIDADGDNVHDGCDNCAGMHNPGQEDTDANGIGDACEAPGICGNGKLEAWEECDDGNLINHDGCDMACQIEEMEPKCGDGKLEGTEQCDDGNKVDGDGCTAECLAEGFKPLQCGNGVTEPVNDEQCDDGNTLDGDGCSQWCKIEGTCGNGVLEVGEQCEDGNTVGGDGCSSYCQEEAAMSYVVGLVFYTGAQPENYKVQIKGFDHPLEDPTHPPHDSVVVVQYYEPKFPVFYALELMPGTYWLVATLSLGLASPTPSGVTVPFPGPLVVGPGETVVGVNVLIPEVDAGESSVAGVVSYDGPLFPQNKLIVMLSYKPPPEFEGQQEIVVEPPVQFPYPFKFNGVDAGPFYAIGFYADIVEGQKPAPGTYAFGMYPTAQDPVQVVVWAGAQITDINFALEPK